MTGFPSPSDNAPIVARNVRLALGRPPARVDILHGIDLIVEQGETVALLGASGSGKSSLMAVLAGLERPTGGEVRVTGLDFTTLDEDALAVARRGRIGIVLQAFHLLPTMTALENVAVPLELAGEPDAFARARDELAAVGLSHRIDHYPAQLSGGEQQRVAIARAVIARPDILLADEPTGNVDEAMADRLIQLFASLNGLGTTVMVATHDTSLFARVAAAHTLRIADGRLTEPASARLLATRRDRR